MFFDFKTSFLVIKCFIYENILINNTRDLNTGMLIDDITKRKRLLKSKLKWNVMKNTIVKCSCQLS